MNTPNGFPVTHDINEYPSENKNLKHGISSRDLLRFHIIKYKKKNYVESWLRLHVNRIRPRAVLLKKIIIKNNNIVNSVSPYGNT